MFALATSVAQGMALPSLLLETGLLQREKSRQVASGNAEAAQDQQSAWSALFHIHQSLVFMQT